MSIANVLLQGFGRGAETLGALTFQEQEQRRREAAQEAQRLKIAEENNAARAALQQEKLEEQARIRRIAATMAKKVGMPVSEGDELTPEMVRVWIDKSNTDRQIKRDEAALQRTLKTNANRRDIAGMGIDAQRGVNDARIAALQAQAAAAQALAATRMGGAAQERPKPSLPMTAQRELGELTDVYALIRDARQGMDRPEAKGATGLKYNIANMLMPASLESRAQSALDGGRGDVVRARLGNLWSTIGKMRSGGAITDAEFKRLEPFLPSTNDDYSKAVSKLDELERAYRDVIDRRVATWGMGYETPDLSQVLTPRAASPATPAPAAPAAGPRRYSPNNPFAGGRP